MSLTDQTSAKQKQQAKKVMSRVTLTKGNHISESGAASMKKYIEAGWSPLDGFQLRYVYFIDPTYKDRLTVPIIPFSKIDEMGAGMYKGKKISIHERSSVGGSSNQ